ncbi:MAG: LLM class flavin-dependent oxidoreductase [Actinomycetes bacterium]
MPDYGHDPLFGCFLPPLAAQAETVVTLARIADANGLDLVTVQDHPYQPAFLDTWTLLSVLAARTSRVRLVPNVANLALRPPAVLARAAASLDILSDGRLELGLGAGAFWDAIVAMGGPRRSPGEAVEALDEAIQVVQALWTPGRTPRIDGRHYRLAGAKPGPFPVHPVGIWLGAYGPRMLRLTGRRADGWLPSQGHAPPEALSELNRQIDEAAAAAGRDPSAVRRLYNVEGTFGSGAGFLQGGVEDWVEQLTELALRDGISGFILSTDIGSARPMQRFAQEVAPAVRDALERARGSGTAPAPSPAAPEAAPTGNASSDGQRLVEVHDHLRAELARLIDLVGQVVVGNRDVGEARSHISTMTMRQNSWTLGTFCETYCRIVAVHHTIEDQTMFPRLRDADPGLGTAIDRLGQEHLEISDVLERVDRALVALVGRPGDVAPVEAAVDLLSDRLLTHLSYEEEVLVGPLTALDLNLV